MPDNKKVIDIEKIASRAISDGIVKAYLLIVLPMAFVTLISLYFSDYDSTDNGKERSGMSLHIDNLTGCHYLYKGGLTPRIDKNGSHYGCGK